MTALINGKVRSNRLEQVIRHGAFVRDTSVYRNWITPAVHQDRGWI